MASALAGIPFHGSGLGFRHEIKKQIWEHRDQIDCVEIITDRYIEHPRLIPELEALCDGFLVIPHGIGLSIGSIRLDAAYLRNVRRVTDAVHATYYSEHLCMTRAPGVDMGHLTPLWFTEEALAVTIENVRQTQDALELPLILENTTYPFVIPDADMGQAEFFHRLVDATGCGILLDITNLRINAENHHFAPVEFLDAMPLEHVVQLHTSGGYRASDGYFIDGHSQPPDEPVWRVLEAFAARASVRGSILEHDASFPSDFSLLLDTISRTRDIFGWRGRAEAVTDQLPAVCEELRA